MKTSIFLIGLILFATVKSQEGSSATALLQSLVLESEQSLQDLRDEWSVNQQLFQTALNSVKSQRDSQAEECSTKNDDLQQTLKEISNTEDYVDWIANRIQENTRRVTELQENRCNSSLLYVNGLKHNKIALQLLEFMREAIAARDSLNLVQTRQIFRQLGVFAQMYKDNKIKEMLQVKVTLEQDDVVHIREDVGTGHIDDGRDQIAVQSFEGKEWGTKTWAEYKAELLTLIDSLHETISTQLQQAQDDEMNAGLSLAEFAIHVEYENKALDRHLYEESEKYGTLTARRAVQKTSVDNCNAQLELAEQQLTTAQGVFQLEVDRFEERKDALQEEVQTFRSVFGMYQLHVGDGSRDANGRQVDQFDFITL